MTKQVDKLPKRNAVGSKGGNAGCSFLRQVEQIVLLVDLLRARVDQVHLVDGLRQRFGRPLVLLLAVPTELVDEPLLGGQHVHGQRGRLLDHPGVVLGQRALVGGLRRRAALGRVLHGRQLLEEVRDVLQRPVELQEVPGAGRRHLLGLGLGHLALGLAGHHGLEGGVGLAVLLAGSGIIRR